MLKEVPFDEKDPPLVPKSSLDRAPDFKEVRLLFLVCKLAGAMGKWCLVEASASLIVSRTACISGTFVTKLS